MGGIGNMEQGQEQGGTGTVVELTFCEGWDQERRSLVGRFDRTTAATRDAQGEQYAVAFTPRGAAVPSVLLQVAWGRGHLGVALFDETGRRIRQKDLRLLKPDALYTLSDTFWRYATEDMPEFADNAWRLRVTMRPGRPSENRLEPEGEFGGSRGVHGDVAEEERWVARPSFGDWSSVLGTEELWPGPVTFADSRPPATEADETWDGEPPWRPPAPLAPRFLEEMFVPGTRFVLGHGQEVTVGDVHEVKPRLRLPTGRLVACDPYWMDEDTAPLTATVPPGDYPVRVTSVFSGAARADSFHRGEWTAVQIVVSEKPTVAWELGLRAGEDVRMLDDGEFYGMSVDTATCCFTDAQDAGRFGARAEDELALGDDEWLTVMDAPDCDGNLIAWAVGGDGGYPVWTGRDASGDITCFLADLLVLHDAELLPAAD